MPLWLFKSLGLYSVYRRDQYLRHRPERAAACRSWIFMAQGALGAAGVRRVGYGLEVGRSIRTAGGPGGGILCRHAHSLFNVQQFFFLSDAYLDSLISNLNSELTCTSKWFAINRLSLNVSRTNFILFCNSRKRYDKCKIKVNLNGIWAGEVCKIPWCIIL